jgi:hypothetical protein
MRLALMAAPSMRYILVTSGLWLALLPAQAGDTELPFQLHGRDLVILVEARVNGKPVTLILDTGAAATILHYQILDIPEMNLRLSRFLAGAPGMRGEAMWAGANLRLGSKLWRERRVVVMNLREVSRVHGRQIDGILGQDILREFDRVVIDFKSRKIILVR